MNGITVMRRTLALFLVVGLLVAIAKADAKLTPRPKPSTLTPQKDSRLAKRPGALPQKIGVLTYYRNVGGGFTFLDEDDIAFYAMPFDASVCNCERTVPIFERARNGAVVVRLTVVNINVVTIGTLKLPDGYYTICRARMIDLGNESVREDEPIAFWFGAFAKEHRLSTITFDHETRIKLKSIIPVLEHAEHGR